MTTKDILGILVVAIIVVIFICLVLNRSMWRPSIKEQVNPDEELGKAVRNLLRWL